MASEVQCITFYNKKSRKNKNILHFKFDFFLEKYNLFVFSDDVFKKILAIMKRTLTELLNKEGEQQNKKAKVVEIDFEAKTLSEFGYKFDERLKLV